MSLVVRIFLACALCGTAWHAGAQVFKVTGPDGRISYTDRPPQDAARSGKVTALSFADYPAQTPVGPDALAKSKPAAPGTAAQRAETTSPFDSSRRLVMFSTAACKYCIKAKSYLGGKGAAFDDFDIDRNPLAAEEFRKLGGKGVPLFVFKGRTMTGFSESGLDALLKL